MKKTEQKKEQQKRVSAISFRASRADLAVFLGIRHGYEIRVSEKKAPR